MQLFECSTSLEGKKRIIKYRINMCIGRTFFFQILSQRSGATYTCHWILVKFENALKSRENDPERRYF